MDGWNTSFPLGWPTFRCYVSFREGNCIVWILVVHVPFGDQLGQQLRNSCIQYFSVFVDTVVEKHLVFSTSIIFPKDCRPILSLSCRCGQFCSKYPQWQFPKSFMLTMSISNDSAGRSYGILGNYPFFTTRQTAKISRAPVESDTKVFEDYVVWKSSNVSKHLKR